MKISLNLRTFLVYSEYYILTRYRRLIYMFKLDIAVFNWVYNQCLTLGSIFEFGALEGLLMYLTLLSPIIIADRKKVIKK